MNSPQSCPQGQGMALALGTSETANKNIIMSSFKSSRDIQKKEGGQDKLNILSGAHWPSG